MFLQTESADAPRYEVVIVDPKHRVGEKAKSKRDARRKARATTFRGLRMLRPLGWLCGLQATAWACSCLPYGWAISLAVSTVTGAVMLARRRAAPATVAAAWVWLVLASIFGPFGFRALLLWVVGVVLGTSHWHRNHTSYTRDGREPQLELESSLTLEQRVYLERVAAKGRALPGTELGAPTPVPNGWTAPILGIPGVHDMDQFRGALRKVASAYETGRHLVTIEPTDASIESQAQVTVLRNASNLDVKRFLENDEGAAVNPETGCARVGYFNDLKPVHFQFWSRESGMKFSLIAGGTGSGKSAFVSSLLSLCHQSPYMVTVLIDPQGGGSQPDWNGQTYRTALGIEAAHYEIRRWNWIFKRRAEMVANLKWVDDKGRARKGFPFLEPSDLYPGVRVVLEEAPLLFEDEEVGEECAELIASGAKTWRKAGGALDIVTQLPSVEDLKKQSLRSMLRSNGNVISFRTGDSVSQNMLGMQEDPSQLPEYFVPSGNPTHGLAYIVGIDRRQASWRAMIPEDPHGIAIQPAAGVLDASTVRFGQEFDLNPDNPGVMPKAKTTAPEALALVEGVHRLMVDSGRALDYSDLLLATTRVVPDGLTMPQLDTALATLAAQNRITQSNAGYQAVQR